MNNILPILGIASGITLVIADIPYIRDILKGKTKPQRVTWGSIAFMNIIGFANQLASGATNSLWLFGTAVIVCGLIFILSLFKGVGGHSKLDIFAIVFAVIGVLLWWLFNSPEISILVTFAVSLVTFAPTLAKTRRHPESETGITWVIGVLSASLGTLSVGALDWRLLLPPLTGVVLQSVMVYFIYFEKKPGNKG